MTESIGGSTERYFDQSELRDLFKLAPPNAACSMLTKFHGQSAIGSSGKPSFLSTHPCVIGVASHDVLYSSTVSCDSATVDLTSPETDTPFSRSPFKNAAQHKPSNNNAEHSMVPLGGGLNRTRENRMNAKVRHEQGETQHASKATECDESYSAQCVLDKANDLIAINEYSMAMHILLGLLECQNNVIEGDNKLKVHENISFVAGKLGWL